MFPTRSDELEADAYARALITLTPDAQLGEVANLLRHNGRAWGRLSDELAARLSLDDALRVLNAGVANGDEQLKLLRRTLEKHPPASWGSEHVEQLALALARHDVQAYEDIDARLLNDVVARHPEAALRGIRDAAQHREVHWTNLFFVEPFPNELLRTELDGPLGETYSILLERKAALAETRAHQDARTRAASRPRRASGPRARAPARPRMRRRWVVRSMTGLSERTGCRQTQSR